MTFTRRNMTFTNVFLVVTSVLLLLKVQIGISEASDVLSERFKRELFWPAHRVSSGFERFSFVGPGNKAGKKDTYFSGIEHEMYVTAGPYHENMSGHVNEGIHHASRILLATPKTEPEAFYADLSLIHGSLAARLFCTHHMKETQHFELENSFLCDWSARRSIAAWRYYHLCANGVFPCVSARALTRDTPWYDLISDDDLLDLKIGVEKIVTRMCDSILKTSDGRSRVEHARYQERLHADPSRLGSTCRALTSTAMYAEMERTVSTQMELVQEVIPMGPDPAVRIRKISEGAFPDLGEWSRVDVERISWIRANVERFVIRSVGTYCRDANMLLEVGPQNWGLLDTFRATIKKIETLDIDTNSETTYNADITKHTDIASERFDCVLFTEVLEHTVEPWNAFREIERILKPGGILIMSTPLNLRLHGPSPDAWRITEFGYRTSLTQSYKFDLIELNAMEDRRRLGLPVHHTVIARRRHGDRGDL